MRELPWDPSRSIDAPLRTRIPTTYHLPDVFDGSYTLQALTLMYGIMHMRRQHKYVIKTSHRSVQRALMEKWWLEYGSFAGAEIATLAYKELRLIAPSVNARRLMAIQQAAWPPNNIWILENARKD